MTTDRTSVDEPSAARSGARSSRERRPGSGVFTITAVSALWLLTLLWLVHAARGAEPPAGMLTAPGEGVAWTGGPITAASPTPASCTEGLSCDVFELELAIPEGWLGRVRFRIDWSLAANDFDLFVYDQAGREVDNSGQALTAFEEVTIGGLAPGRYRVVTNAFAAAAERYAGEATLLELEPAPPDPPKPVLSETLRFAPTTLVDFSAVSGEPFLRVDREDRVFVSVPFGVSTTVSLLWRSSDGGRTFVPLGAPIVRDAVAGPGGGDTHQDFDDRNRLYYVDLSAACVTAAVSEDGGDTFPPERSNLVTCLSDENPEAAADDRQWVGAFGDGVAYATWRNLVTSPFWMFKTTDGGLTWDAGRLLGEVGQSGPFQVDRTRRTVEVDGASREAILSYQIYYQGSRLRVFRILDLDDGSEPIVDDLAIADPGESVGNVFPVLAIDVAGNLYAVWSQGAHTVYLATSRDFGESWSAPARVSPLAGTNIMPWVVAGDPGRIDVVWYQSDLKGNPVDPTSEWRIYMAQSLDALSASPTFELARVSDTVIHRGEICLEGLSCDLSTALGEPRDRSFLEFPSIDVDSRGAAFVTYNDNTNQVDAPYVMVARQVAGHSLYAAVGELGADAGEVTVERPATAELIRGDAMVAEGGHSLPPASFDRDEAGDARFPDHGPVSGVEVPALDLHSVGVEEAEDELLLRLRVADLSVGALEAAPLLSGGDGVLYLVQWDHRDVVRWVAAEVRAGVASFRTGTLGRIDSATSKKYVTWAVDPVASLEGSVELVRDAPGEVRIRVPRSAVGSPVDGETLFNLTAYALSQRGPLVPIDTAQDNDGSSLPIQVDATGAVSYPLGASFAAGGAVEAAVDDPGFASPIAARLVGLPDADRWRLELDADALGAGEHVLHVRQRITGRAPSAVVAVPFEVSATVSRDVTTEVAQHTDNARFTSDSAHFDLALENLSSSSIGAPVIVEVVELTSASGAVRVSNADNGLPGVGARFGFDGLLGADAVLAPGERSGARTLSFEDPDREPFSLTLRVLGERPRLATDGSTARTGSATRIEGAETGRVHRGEEEAKATVTWTVTPAGGGATVERR